MVSIWEKETFFAQQDVLIIGSGVVGLWSAFFLKKHDPSLKITIVDRGIIPTGASTRNAGFACFGSLSEIMSDIKTMGLDATLSLVEKRYRGLEKIQKYFSPEEIDFDLAGGYELFETGSTYTNEELENSIGYLNTLLKDITGSKKTFRTCDDKINEFGFGATQHLVKNKLEGYLHSGKLIQGLLQKVQGMGVQVFNQTEVLSYEQVNSSIAARTNHHYNIITKKILICTNAFGKELLPEEDIIPARGQIIVTSPINNLPFKGTFHADEGFYYFRNLGNRVLLGGARNKAFEEERTTEMKTTAFIQKELQRYLDEIVLPQHKGTYSIQYSWSGIMGMGSIKAPIVKQVQQDIYCAVRMSGMGVALAPVVAQEVVQLMFP